MKASVSYIPERVVPRRHAPTEIWHHRRLGKCRHADPQGQGRRQLPAAVQPRRAVADRRSTTIRLPPRSTTCTARRFMSTDIYTNQARDAECSACAGSAITTSTRNRRKEAGAVQRHLPRENLSQAGRPDVDRHGPPGGRGVGRDGQRQDGDQRLVRPVRRHDGRSLRQRLQPECLGHPDLRMERALRDDRVQEQHVQQHAAATSPRTSWRASRRGRRSARPAA